MSDLKIYQHLNPEPIQGCIHIPYKGFIISISNVGGYDQVAILSGDRKNILATVEYNPDTIKAAFDYIDNLDY